MDDRRVRPRVEAVLGNAAAPDRSANHAHTDVGRALATVCSPLVALLETAVSSGKVVKDPKGEVYTGFASYRDLAGSQCDFVPMNSNRAINREVVRQRVDENVNSFDRAGCYMEFGQINLIVVAGEASHEFLVMDGQHRCETMKELFRQYPDRDIWFQFRAKLVASEPLAFEELRHFQRAYPTDSRSFFRSRAESRVATAVLLRLKTFYGDAFKPMVLSDRHGRGTGDPQRPYLNDNLLFWLLQDAQLLGAATPVAGLGVGVAGAGDSNGNPPAGAEDNLLAATPALEVLERANALLATLPRNELGKGATDNMCQVASRLGCWLGFFREGMLQWKDIKERLEATPPLRGRRAGSGANDRPPARGPAPAGGAASRAVREQQADCVVCLELPPTCAMLPCGHRCVCEGCARAIRAARPPQCPICREPVTDATRIFV